MCFVGNYVRVVVVDFFFSKRWNGADFIVIVGWKRCEKLLGCRLIKWVFNNYNKLIPLMCLFFLYHLQKNVCSSHYIVSQGHFNVMYQLLINGQSFYDVHRFVFCLTEIYVHYHFFRTKMGPTLSLNWFRLILY